MWIDLDDFMCLAEYARHIGKTTTWVHKLIREKKLPYILFRSYSSYGYLTDNRNFGYDTASHSCRKVGELILSNTGKVFYANLKDIPEKLKQLIDQKKDKEFRMTFTTNEYTYLTVGYGTKDTDGYSIKVRGVTLDGETIYVGTSLYGPRENEKVSSTTTTPYIVLKTEKRSKTVVYK